MDNKKIGIILLVVVILIAAVLIFALAKYITGKVINETEEGSNIENKITRNSVELVKTDLKSVLERQEIVNEVPTNGIILLNFIILIVEKGNGKTVIR